MTNEYTINEDVSKDFVQYNAEFEDGQPIFATKACLSLTELALWPNRLPQHEPWPRQLLRDSDDEINTENDGYKNNVDSLDQYDNTTRPDGRQPIGRVEGDEKIDRNTFWRR